MKKTISIGKQSFSSLREHDNFFVDKTNFIKEWWEKEDDITLIARPRRFGKTLNMSMLECFFSNKYANRADLFEGLSIWEEEKYRQLQGTYPVIFLSFASVKADNLTEAKIQIKQEIAVLYEENRYLLKKDILSDNERRLYNRTTEQMDDTTAQKAIRNMAGCTAIMVRMSSFFWMNMIHQCRKHICRDIGMNILPLSEVCLMRHLRQILIWNEPL